MKNKFKRIEWLNLYSRGFVVESINNNYKNEDIIIERKNKTSSRKINKKIDKNITFEKISSIPQNKNKTKNIISLDKKNHYFINLNEFTINQDDNIINKKEIKKDENKKEIKKKKNKKKNKSTININFININQNIIVKKPEKKRELKNKRKEIKNKISSPLINYLSLQTQKENKMLKIPIKKSDNKNQINFDINKKINNGKEIEIENKKDIKLKKINLNLYNYINYKNDYSKQNKKRNEYGFDNGSNFIKFGDLGGYTFDDESIMTEGKNIGEFSEICNTTSNNLIINDKSKVGLNMFLCGNTKHQDFKKRKVEELKLIIDEIKK